MLRPALCAALLVAAVSNCARLPAAEADQASALVLHARSRVEDPREKYHFQCVYKTLQWEPKKTAIVICDMWDKHWCRGATARVAEMAPRMNQFVMEARKRGVLVIHAPSDTTDAYKDTPQRKLAQQAPKVEPKVPLRPWCSLDPKREPPLPIDDSDGGCDTPPDKPHKAWSRQIEAIRIEPGDAITDSAEAYYLIEQRGIENVIVLGVHTNMCVLGRPFSIRQMVYQGKNVVLVRDLTDAMYNPQRAPFVDHFRGTEMVIEHIEKYWCPTITSADLLGGAAFRSEQDQRPHVVFLISEDEYRADATLGDFAETLRDCFGYYCTVVRGHQKHDLTGIEALRTADVAVLFVRRRALPKAQLDVLRAYLDAGKPLVALRTASHAFAIDGGTPPGSDQWPAFDRDVLGCVYHGHSPNALGTDVAAAAPDHPILAGVKPLEWHSRGSLYLVSPVEDKATVLLTGSALDLAQPVAWTRSHKGGRVFYTTLGHREDFAQPQFSRLLINAVHWAMGRPVPKLQVDLPPGGQSRK